MQPKLASNCLCGQGFLGLVFLHLPYMSCLWGLNVHASQALCQPGYSFSLDKRYLI